MFFLFFFSSSALFHLIPSCRALLLCLQQRCVVCSKSFSLISCCGLNDTYLYILYLDRLGVEGEFTSSEWIVRCHSQKYSEDTICTGGFCSFKHRALKMKRSSSSQVDRFELRLYITFFCFGSLNFVSLAGYFSVHFCGG